MVVVADLDMVLEEIVEEVVVVVFGLRKVWVMVD